MTDPSVPSDVLRAIADEFYEEAMAAQVNEDGWGFDEISDDPLQARSDALRDAAQRCREIADGLEDNSD